MNRKNPKIFGIKTFEEFTSHLNRTQFDRLCSKIELETAVYSDETKNYLMLLKAIRNVDTKY